VRVEGADTLLVTTQDAEPPKNADAKCGKSQPNKKPEHSLVASRLHGRFGGAGRQSHDVAWPAMKALRAALPRFVTRSQ